MSLKKGPFSTEQAAMKEKGILWSQIGTRTGCGYFLGKCKFCTKKSVGEGGSYWGKMSQETVQMHNSSIVHPVPYAASSTTLWRKKAAATVVFSRLHSWRYSPERFTIVGNRQWQWWWWWPKCGALYVWLVCMCTLFHLLFTCYCPSPSSLLRVFIVHFIG